MTMVRLLRSGMVEGGVVVEVCLFSCGNQSMGIWECLLRLKDWMGAAFKQSQYKQQSTALGNGGWFESSLGIYRYLWPKQLGEEGFDEHSCMIEVLCGERAEILIIGNSFEI